MRSQILVSQKLSGAVVHIVCDTALVNLNN
jgi:hypothetical protein